MKQYRYFIVAALSLLLLLGAACSREAKQTSAVQTTTSQGTSTTPAANQAEKMDRALVRMVNAMPNGPAVDVFSDNWKAFDSVRPKNVTAYKEMKEERVNLELKAAGKDNAPVMAQNSEGLNAGQHYTIIAIPAREGHVNPATTDEGWREQPNTANRRDQAPAWKDNAGMHAQLMVVSDNLTPPDQGKAKIRVINAAPEVGEIRVVAIGANASDRNRANEKARRNDKGGNELFSGVNYQSEAGYKEVDPMTGNLRIEAEDKDKNRPAAAATITNLNLEAGKIYTIIVTSHPKTGKLEAIRIEDELVQGGSVNANAY